MKTATVNLILSACLGLATMAPARAAVADLEFRSGGATVEEFAAMDRMSGAYSLKLVLAAKDGGAYLADVDVQVHALPSHTLMLQTRTQGPLLLAALPPGRYALTASVEVRPGATSTLKRTIVIPASGQQKLVMYFNTGDEVSPESGPEYRTR